MRTLQQEELKHVPVGCFFKLGPNDDKTFRVLKQYIGYKKCRDDDGVLCIPHDPNGSIIRDIPKTVVEYSSMYADFKVKKTFNSEGIYVMGVMLDDNELRYFNGRVLIEQSTINDGIQERDEVDLLG